MCNVQSPVTYNYSGVCWPANYAQPSAYGPANVYLDYGDQYQEAYCHQFGPTHQQYPTNPANFQPPFNGWQGAPFTPGFPQGQGYAPFPPFWDPTQMVSFQAHLQEQIRLQMVLSHIRTMRQIQQQGWYGYRQPDPYSQPGLYPQPGPLPFPGPHSNPGPYQGPFPGPGPYPGPAPWPPPPPIGWKPVYQDVKGWQWDPSTDFGTRDPLVVDLNGDGTFNMDPGKIVNFDLNGDGIPDQVHGWSTQDGFLVQDKDGNGRIDNGTEMFGPTSNNGIAELKQFDKNGDGKLSRDELKDLKIWKDSNGDGKSDPGELKTLQELGIEGIEFKGDREFTLKRRLGWEPVYGGPQPGPVENGGKLDQPNQGGPITYTTHGGYKVEINRGEVKITSPDGKTTLTNSGDPHEYLNGQHIKDWDEKTRTLILADGTKITMNATGPQGEIQTTDIYDGGQAIHIQNNNNQVTEQVVNPQIAQDQEREQADGETSWFGADWQGRMVYNDLYTQDADLGYTNLYRELGYVQDGKVTDLYDAQDSATRGLDGTRTGGSF